MNNYIDAMKYFIAPDGLVNQSATKEIPDSRNGGNRVMLSSLARIAEDHLGLNPVVSPRFYVYCIKVSDKGGLYLKRHPDSDEPQAHDDYIYLMTYLATRGGRLDREVLEGLYITCEMNQYSMFNQQMDEFVLKKWFGRHWHFEAHMQLCAGKPLSWFNSIRLSIRLLMDCFIKKGILSGVMQRMMSVFIYVNYHKYRYLPVTISCFIWQTVMQNKYRSMGYMMKVYRNYEYFPPADLFEKVLIFPMIVKQNDTSLP